MVQRRRTWRHGRKGGGGERRSTTTPVIRREGQSIKKKKGWSLMGRGEGSIHRGAWTIIASWVMTVLNSGEGHAESFMVATGISHQHRSSE